MPAVGVVVLSWEKLSCRHGRRVYSLGYLQVNRKEAGYCFLTRHGQSHGRRITLEVVERSSALVPDSAYKAPEDVH